MSRFCVNGCGNKLGPMQGANSQCRVCKKRHADAEKGMKRQKVSGERTKSGFVLLHSCVASEWDNFDFRKCQCRKILTKEEVGDLFRQNLIRNLRPDFRRADGWDGQGDVFLLNRLNQTPRVPTLEQAHILRGVEQAWKHRGKTQMQLEAEHQDLQRRIAEDKLEKCEEERYRWTVWQELDQEWLRSITIEIPEGEWLAAEKAARGDLACRTILSIDERTSAGADYERSDTNESDDESESAPQSEPVAIDDDRTTDNEVDFESFEDLTEAEAA